MKKRVTTGFLSIVALLFVAGMISLFELGRLSNDAESLMNESRANMESAKEMLDALSDHNMAVSHIVMTGHNLRNDTLCRNSLERLESTLASVTSHAKNNHAVDSLILSVNELRVLTTEFLGDDTGGGALDRTILKEFEDAFLNVEELSGNRDIYWYDLQYDALRAKISNQINDFMTLAFNGLTPQTEQLSRNAYRAVTPVLISLLVMIAIVLMLLYFVIIYCVQPIVEIDKGLVKWLKFRQSFTVKAQCRDELHELKENIENLINTAEKHGV